MKMKKAPLNRRGLQRTVQSHRQQTVLLSVIWYHKLRTVSTLPQTSEQRVKTGSNDIPNLNGLKKAINKKQSDEAFLADINNIREAYVQDVRQSRSDVKSIPQAPYGVNIATSGWMGHIMLWEQFLIQIAKG